MSDNASLLAGYIENYRKKLLDLTKRNNLISFKFTARAPQFVRIIDTSPENAFAGLNDERKLTFRALPDFDEESATNAESGHARESIQTELPHSSADDKNGLLPIVLTPLGVEYAESVTDAAAKPRKAKLSNAEIAQACGINPAFDLPQPESGEARPKDSFLQTLLKAPEMESLLSKLESYIRTDAEERGVNTLYAAFLFLEHYDADSSDTALYSPLILMPLKMEKNRSPAGYSFTVEKEDSEAGLNPSLSEMLKTEFGIELPKFDSEAETAASLAAYAEKIEKIILTAKAILPQKGKWRLRRFLTVGRFHFDRLVMYQDLENEHWPEDKALVHNPILENLMAKSTDSGDAGYALDYDIDALEAEHKAPLLITEADASQHSAIADVMAGKNLAIQGPPGTGKSQTIANIIANALMQGKKVLFLAEKMAALNVVYERLNHAGLGDFCLELHSAKARKTEILKSIKQRLKIHGAPDNEAILAAKEDEFNAQTAIIKNYTDRLNQPFGKMGRTVYDYLWALKLEQTRLGEEAETAQLCAPAFEAADIDENTLNRIKKWLDELSELKDTADAGTEDGVHPWSFVTNSDLDSFTRDELLSRLKAWNRGLSELLETNAELLKILPLNPSVSDIARFMANSSALRRYDAGALDESMLSCIDSFDKAQHLAEFAQNIKRCEELRSKIRVLSGIDLSPEYADKIDEACREAQALKADSLTADEIAQELAKQAQALQVLRGSEPLISLIQRNLGLDGGLNCAQLAAMLKAPLYADSVPAEYLKYRLPQIMDAANAAALQQAFDRQAEVKNILADVPEGCDLMALGRYDEIAADAALLEKAGAFAFLSSDYRRAKKSYLAACKGKSAFKPAHAAAHLRKMAEAKERRRALDNDKSLETLCGDAFCGADTDFEAMRHINLWAEEIRKNYDIIDGFSRKIREHLFRADAEKLNALREIAHEDLFKALQAIFAELKDICVNVSSYDQLIEHIEKRHAALEHLLSVLRDMRGGTQLNFRFIQAELNDYQQMQALETAAAQDNIARNILGNAFDGIKTDEAILTPLTEFTSLCAAVPELKAIMPSLFRQNFHAQWTDLLRKLDSLEQHCQKLSKEGNAVCAAAHADFSAFGAEDWQNLPLPRLNAIMTEALSLPSALRAWIDYHHALASLPAIAAPLAQAWLDGKRNLKTLPSAFQYMIYYALGREIYRRNPELKERGLRLDSARSLIKELGSRLLILNREKIFTKLSIARPLEGNGSGPRKTWTEAALLFNEAKKEKRHIPVRDLMQRAGRSVLAIKPCFLMSPFTVAQYLAPGTLEFDLLVIDEASQMRPEEALGGIARAKQIVVVGDPKQLPPTAFFQSSNDNDDEDEEDILPDEDIMQLALTAYRPARILTRHYRSRHESLIAFSNSEFYDNNLLLFPSPSRRAEGGMGLVSHYIGGHYEASCNMAEAQAAVKAALQFMRDNPEKSLGIATMNVKQRDLIEDEMDKAFREHDYAEDYRLYWKDRLEPFFIKNLENVQGDERDAIFISTVYGPDARGNVMQRFGPINQAGGERRLNVLFSRAKDRMEIFTSLHPEDVHVSETSSKGLRAFKGFLAYAQTGKLDSGIETHREPDSDFEIWVKEKLESIGCEAVPQVGVGGFRIDLGVKHPRWPYGYLLGVECDGKTYHSSKSARERDIYRQKILEGLGWNIYRIWSSDWFADPNGEFEKLKQHINRLLENLPPKTVREAEMQANQEQT